MDKPGGEVSDPKYCPECSTVWVDGRKKCGDCGYKLPEDKFQTGTYPPFCMWDRCDRDTAVVFVEASKDGRVYRKPASDLFFRDQIRPGWAFITWVTRCADHFLIELDAQKKDWREQAIHDYQAAHPEFSHAPKDGAERKDLISMATFLSRKRQGEYEIGLRSSRTARLEVGRRLAEKENELLPDEIPYLDSIYGTMPDSIGGYEVKRSGADR